MRENSDKRGRDGFQGRGILLHCCCAPCATVATERLREHFEPGLFFYNPNVEPEEEYVRRLASMRLLSRESGLVLHEGTWDNERFREAVRGLESEVEGGARCARCFDLRLYATAQKAVELGIGRFASTLSVSPHKRKAAVDEAGRKAASEYGVEYVATDFKKKEGFKRSVELSRGLGLYRQDYCGCLFSKR